MPYKISGTLSDAARIIIIKESDWSIESNTTESVGSYEVDSLITGAKLVVARKSDGEALIYGNITPSYYAPLARGVFGSGLATGGADTKIIEYITISTTGDATVFGDLTTARRGLAACSNGTTDRGVFGSGLTNSNIIDYITISTTGDALDFGDLTVGRNYTSANSNGTNDRGVWGGGGSTVSNVIDYITISSVGNATNFGDLTAARNALTATSNSTNNRGVFAGGHNGSNLVDIIDYITISSTGDAADFGNLTASKRSLSGTSNGANDRGVFGGGQIVEDTSSINVIDYITITSTGNANDFGDLTLARRYTGACSDGTNNRGVWAGGYQSYFNIIDYVTISSTSNAQDFGDLTAAKFALAGTSNA